MAETSDIMLKPFNSDLEFTQLAQEFIHNYRFQTAIETGTYRGSTTRWLAKEIGYVYTIETDEIMYMNVDLSRNINIEHIYGKSETILPSILAKIPSDEKVFIYLDAHWGDSWPILDELRAIRESKVKCMVVIDDMLVPNRPDIQFDSFKGLPLSIQYLTPVISHFHNISMYIPSNNTYRGKLICDNLD